MRNLSNLIALSFSLYISVQAHAAFAADDGFDGPVWVATFGDVSPSEMSNSKYLAQRTFLTGKHVDPTQNKSLANLWEVNGTLPLIDHGYYLLSKNAALEIKTPCLYELPTMNQFCVTSSKEVRLRHNDTSLSDSARKAATIITMTDIKSLNSEQVRKLNAEAHDVQNDIIGKTADDKIPPIQYVRLGLLKGYLEGLDPHSDVLLADELLESLEYTLSVTKDRDIITIKFDHFGDDVSKKIATQLKALYNEGDRILLDLRGNGGGRVDEAMGLTKLFLGKSYEDIDAGNLLYATSGKSTHARKIRVNHPTYETYYEEAPMVVLVNQKSASASEIVAGLLQQEGRAFIIGNLTHGKGTYLDVLSLVKDKIAAIVTEKTLYMRGSKTAQINGIVPDMAFPLTENERAATVREGDNANALVPVAIVDNDQTPRTQLAQSIQACGLGIARQRGSGPLKDAQEAITLGEDYLKRCFGPDDKQILGVAR